MSLKAKGLLSLMLSLPDDWQFNLAGLVTLSKDGKDSVMSALSELEKFGYLQRVKLTNSKGQFAGVEYNIYEEPQEALPVADNQNSEKQEEEKQNAGKPPQLNTNTLTTKESNNNESMTNDIYKEKLYNILENNIKNRALKELYQEYIEMRIMIDAPLTARGLEMLIRRCERLANMDMALQKALVEAAIINNWKNVYLPNEQDIQNNNQMADLRRVYGNE